MNVKTFHHFPHPKHLKICFVGETINDGVFSPWNGQHAQKLLPFLLRGIYLEITSTISTRPRTSSTSEFGIQIFLTNLKKFVWLVYSDFLFIFQVREKKKPPFGKGGAERSETEGFNPPVASLSPPYRRGIYNFILL